MEKLTLDWLTGDTRNGNIFEGGDLFRPTAVEHFTVTEKYYEKVAYTLTVYEYVTNEKRSYELTTQLRAKSNQLVNVSVTVFSKLDYNTACQSIFQMWDALGKQTF